MPEHGRHSSMRKSDRGVRQMDLTSLLVQAISGAIGGSAAGAAAKDYSLGTLRNALAGALGGGRVGQVVGPGARAGDDGRVGNIRGGGTGGVGRPVLVGGIRELRGE